MKVMAIDYGRRRIGIAITDETGTIIRGLPTLDRKKHSDILLALKNLCVQHSPQKLVVGIPLDSSNKETSMSLEVRNFAQQLEEFTSITVDCIDESFSSKQAKQLLHLKKKKYRRQKGAIDRIAACLILQTYQKDFM